MSCKERLGAPGTGRGPVPRGKPLPRPLGGSLAPDAIIIVNAAGQIVLVNSQKAETLFRYRREEMIDQPVEMLVPEGVRARHVEHRARYQAHPQVRPMGVGQELYGRRKGGEEFPVEISLSPLAAAEGHAGDHHAPRCHGAATWVRPCYAEAEARFRTLVEEIPAVTFMAALDEGSNELYVSPQVEALLGFTQKEWIEDPILWYRQLHPEDRERWNTEFAPTCADGKPFASVYRFVARDGRVVWVHGEAKMVRDEAGRPAFLQGVAFDITAIKQAEDEMRLLNQTLEERVRDRTAVAEQRAQALARSNDNLEQFGYVVAHDLRQPLRTMKSFTQKLAVHCQELLDDKGREYVARIVNGADRMRVLIDDLLTYSRVGTQGKSFAAVELAAVFGAARASLEAAIEESGAAVTAATLPSVWGDETQLVQLLQNLIQQHALSNSTATAHRDASRSRRGRKTGTGGSR